MVISVARRLLYRSHSLRPTCETATTIPQMSKTATRIAPRAGQGAYLIQTLSGRASYRRQPGLLHPARPTGFFQPHSGQGTKLAATPGIVAERPRWVVQGAA